MLNITAPPNLHTCSFVLTIVVGAVLLLELWFLFMNKKTSQPAQAYDFECYWSFYFLSQS